MWVFKIGEARPRPMVSRPRPWNWPFGTEVAGTLRPAFESSTSVFNLEVGLFNSRYSPLYCVCSNLSWSIHWLDSLFLSFYLPISYMMWWQIPFYKLLLRSSTGKNNLERQLMSTVQTKLATGQNHLKVCPSCSLLFAMLLIRRPNNIFFVWGSNEVQIDMVRLWKE